MNQTSTRKPRIVILEGVDRTGKSTFQDEIDRQTKYRHIVIDRGTIGFKAYCEIYNKGAFLLEQYQQMEERLCINEDVLIVYLDCETNELVDRCIRTNHEILAFAVHKVIYEREFEKSLYENKIKVNTTNKHASEIVQELIKEGVL